MSTGECHILISGNKYEKTWVKIGHETICKRNNIQLSGMRIDYDLKFEKHFFQQCKIANKK